MCVCAYMCVSVFVCMFVCTSLADIISYTLPAETSIYSEHHEAIYSEIATLCNCSLTHAVSHTDCHSHQLVQRYKNVSVDQVP